MASISVERATDTRRDRRKRAILDAARSLFLEKGYGATTLSDIVSRSGGSLTTIYDLFGNKPGLLCAMVEERCARLANVIERASMGSRGPAEALREIAEYMFDQLNEPEAVALFRIVIAESPRLPELGRHFYESGPVVAQAKLADYLARETALGTLRVDDPALVAPLFFQMIIGNIQLQLLCSIPTSLTPEAKARHLDHVVAVFLNLFGPKHRMGDI